MNNEPVAWISNTTLQNLQMPFLSQVTHRISVKANTMDEFTIPLYTAPRELSDEEIDLIAKPFLENMEGYSYYGESLGISEDRYIDFARAILKKASEK